MTADPPPASACDKPQTPPALEARIRTLRETYPAGRSQARRAPPPRRMARRACDRGPRSSPLRAKGQAAGTAARPARRCINGVAGAAAAAIRAAHAVGLSSGSTRAIWCRSIRHHHPLPRVSARAHHGTRRREPHGCGGGLQAGNSAAAEHFLRHALPRMGFPIRRSRSTGLRVQGEV